MKMAEASFVVQVPCDKAGWLDSLMADLPRLAELCCERFHLEALEPPQYRGRVPGASDHFVTLQFTFQAVAE